MRIRKSDLENAEDRVNALLNNIKLKVSYRYGYTAIDILDDKGRVLVTLVAGLTKREAYDVLHAIHTVIREERSASS